jgi:hypothetical protein
MKPCHAAALALLGWYLMVPPPMRLSDGRIDPDMISDLSAPLPHWYRVRSFDTAAACTAELEVMKRRAAVWKRQAAREHPLPALGEPENRCVSSDDPRLGTQVKTTRAAAPRVSGWYLMVPPGDLHTCPNRRAPISEWQILAWFDVAAKCESVNDRDHQHYDDMASEQRGSGVCAEMTPYIAQMIVEECIATDDPRLKSN